MICSNCKAEWTPPSGISITQCPFCGNPLFEIQNSRKNAEPHEILLKIVQQYDRKKLGDSLLKGMLSDLMPHVEKKYQRIFKQAIDDKIGSKLLFLEDEDESVRVIRISSIKDSFKNNNGFDQTANYVVDCFLFALGWIETINKEQYSQGGVDILSITRKQIDRAFIDGVLKKEEAKLLFSSAHKFGLPENDIVDMINAKIKSLKFKPYPGLDKSIKNKKEIICSYDWYSEELYQTKKKSDSTIQKKAIQNRSYPDGSIYIGNFNKGKRHGSGLFTWPTGLKYDGEWKYDKRNGRGILIWPTGEKYEGEWKDDKCNGNGILIWPIGHKYEGEWKDDKRNGRGIMIYRTGEKYEGEWKDDNLNGRGIMIWPTGEKYEGEWKNDKRYGRGVYTDQNKIIKKGCWRNDIWVEP